MDYEMGSRKIVTEKPEEEADEVNKRGDVKKQKRNVHHQKKRK